MKFKTVKLHWCQAFVVSALLALFIFIVVPTQTYLGSPDLFDFSYWRLVGAGAIGAVALTAIFFCTILLAGRIIGALAPILGLALLACLYLETGILSIGLPALNGVAGFGNLIRGGLDALAWLAVIGLFVIFRSFVARNFWWFSASLALLILASVFDAGGGTKVGISSSLSDGFCPRYDVVKSVRFSRSRNVMIYILDMTPATIMTDVMERNPELKEKFPGFTCFRKNLCMHAITLIGVPGLLTGRYLTPLDDLGEYSMSDVGENSFLIPYAQSSNAVYYATAARGFGYTNRRTQFSPASKLQCGDDEGVFGRHSVSIPNFRMCDAILIRIAPYLLKNRFYIQALNSANTFRPITPNADDEDVTYPLLANADTVDEPLVLSVIHTFSIHYPIRFDRSGNRLKSPLTMAYGGKMDKSEILPYREAMREAGVWELTRVGRLFDALREKGVYDNSTIILVADHGCTVMKDGLNHGCESGILWVKPEGSQEGFRYSDAPTTNAKIHDFVCALKNAPLDANQIETCLSSPVRIFRADFRGKMLHALGFKLRYKDWIYDSDAHLVEVRQMRE